jgi:glycerol-3-phosphate dehydrogenase (NAD(P)+)
MTNVAIVGAGSWGTALAAVVGRRCRTVLWAREPSVIEAINRDHHNPLFLTGKTLPSLVTASASLSACVAGADVVMLALPSRFFRSVLRQAAADIAADVALVSLTKGLEDCTLLRMTQVAASELPGHPPDRIGVLSGPNIAREIIEGQPGATVVAFPDARVASGVQELLMGEDFRVYTNTDVVGCEIGGSVKNVIALAAGMAVGLGYGANSQAALVTRGLAELTRLGVALGGQPLTFLGLAGVGDLFVTCTSPDSRNRTVGVELGQGRPLTDILAGMTMVAEGVETAGSVVELAGRAGVEMPVSEQVLAVLQGDRRPAEAVGVLMHRPGKSELDGL